MAGAHGRGCPRHVLQNDNIVEIQTFDYECSHKNAHAHTHIQTPPTPPITHTHIHPHTHTPTHPHTHTKDAQDDAASGTARSTRNPNPEQGAQDDAASGTASENGGELEVRTVFNARKDL
jgi:hypothetical protein